MAENDDSREILAVLKSQFADLKAELKSFVLQAVYEAHRQADTERWERIEERLDDMERRQDNDAATSGMNWRLSVSIAIPTLLSVISLVVVIAHLK